MPARFVEIEDFGSDIGNWSLPASWTANWTLSRAPAPPSGLSLYAMTTSAALYTLHFLLVQLLSRRYVKKHGHAHCD